MTKTVGVEHQRELTEADAIYERYVLPLEADHRGEFVAVTPNGRTFLGDGLDDVVDQIIAELGPGSGGHIFKVGDLIVGRWR